MLLLADDVGSRDLEPKLKKLGLPVELTALPSADIAFTGKGDGGVPFDIGIEYKKLPELIQSMRTGRLQDPQVRKMRKAYDANFLIIVGELLYDADGRLLKRAGARHFRPMQGGMALGELLRRVFVLHACHGLTPIWCRIETDALRQVEAVYRTWTDKARDQHTSHTGIYRAPALVEISEFRRFITAIEGIGVRTSLDIDRHFRGSLRAAIAADEAEWRRIPGIGPKLASHIIDVFEGRAAK